MASPPFLALALALPMAGLVLVDPPITISNQDPHDSLVYATVHAFLFFLLTIEFFSAICLLVLSVAAPRSTLFIKHLSMATRVLVSATLLLEVPLMLHTAVTEIPAPGTLMAMFVGAAAAAVILKCIPTPFIGHFKLANQNAGILVPAFTTLYIPTGIFIFIEPFLFSSDVNHENTLIPVPIQLLILSLNWLNFLLTIVLLFLRITVAADEPQNPIPAVLIAHLVEATLAMSFATTALIVYYVVPPLLLGII
jgi:hypothetical protein